MGKLLRAALNISWKQHVTNEELYGNLLKIQSTKCESCLIAIAKELNKKLYISLDYESQY